MKIEGTGRYRRVERTTTTPSRVDQKGEEKRDRTSIVMIILLHFIIDANIGGREEKGWTHTGKDRNLLPRRKTGKTSCNTGKPGKG